VHRCFQRCLSVLLILTPTALAHFLSAEGMTTERAYEVMDEADAFGLALVVIVSQETAEGAPF